MKVKSLVAILFLLFGLFFKSFGQVYITDHGNKKKAFKYYFAVMDSLVNASPNDSFFVCVNCVQFLEYHSKIRSSGKPTYFGTFDFSKADLQNWRKWWEKKYLKE